jgi:prepilin-type N-terminal cleavage/methylation domain-containing protein
MPNTLRRQDGFTLVELLMVMTISLVIFGATLSSWTSVYRGNRAVEQQNDNAEEARVALDRAARQLRNLANPTVNAITTIDRATDYDFIFQTSDPSKTWIRYCLQTTGAGTTPTKARLWESESAGAISAAMRGACPGSGWTRSSIVVNNVTNTRSGIDRDIFTYECNISVAGACPASTADYTKIENVGISLWVDQDTTDRASELDVTTAVFLRNQNEAPTAVVSDPRTISLPLRKYLLNGSGSTDPEGRTLEYFWFEGAAPTAAQLATACTATPTGVAWEGVTFIKRFPTGTAGQTATFHLLVRDPGCLTSLFSPITVTVPT